MAALHHLVAARKVLYLGISDTPSFIVAKANMYARLTGKTPFVIYQGAWNIMSRDVERDIIPMIREEGAFYLVLDIWPTSDTALQAWRSHPTMSSPEASSVVMRRSRSASRATKGDARSTGTGSVPSPSARCARLLKRSPRRLVQRA